MPCGQYNGAIGQALVMIIAGECGSIIRFILCFGLQRRAATLLAIRATCRMICRSGKIRQGRKEIPSGMGIIEQEMGQLYLLENRTATDTAFPSPCHFDLMCKAE